MLPGLVRTVAETLRLPYAAVELGQNGERQVVAAYGQPGDAALARYPLVYQQETIGSLVAAPRTGSAEFGPADQGLLENIASQASAVAHAVRLSRRLDWVNCGLCVDERGVAESIDGVRRGTPADFWRMSLESGNTLTAGTR